MCGIETTHNKKTISSGAENLNDEMYGKYLTFWSDRQLFGVPIFNVQQIVTIEKITGVPDFPDYAKGIINLRGSIIPIIDMRLRFHKKEIPYNERTCIIVTDIKNNLIGLAVDAVDEVTMIEDGNISGPPKVTQNDNYDYLTGIAKIKNKAVLLLNAEKIFSSDEAGPFAEVS